MVGRRAQEQSGGAGSTNMQASRDVVFHQGITVTEVRDIVLDLFKANFLEMTGAAEEKARERVEEITNEYLKQLGERNPAGLASVQDPDMLVSIYNAQKGYACSGDVDLEGVLVDLLVDRSGQKTRDIKTLVLNQAIECLPRLTIAQRRAIAFVFFVRYTQYRGAMVLPIFYQYLAANLGPFADLAANKPADYRYILSTGAGIGVVPRTLEKLFWNSCCGYFSKGFSADQILPEARRFIDDRSVIVPCIRDPQKLQMNAISLDQVKKLQEVKGIQVAPGRAGPLESACLYGQMADWEIRENLVTHLPFMAQVFDHWENSGLGSVDLTVIGIAIGNAYWHRVTGGPSLLDMWLSA
jgi:hypothetical protein